MKAIAQDVYGSADVLRFRRPKVPVRGLALAGVVAATGSGVTRFQPGGEVFGICRTGSFADAAEAIRQIATGHATGKSVVTI